MDITDQAIHAAIKSLRASLNISQQQLAIERGKAVTSVARWETSRIPELKELAGLFEFAAQHGRRKEADIFKAKLQEELGLRVSRQRP